MPRDPFRDAERTTDCPKCPNQLAWNREDGLRGQTCACGYEFTGRERNRKKDD